MTEPLPWLGLAERLPHLVEAQFHAYRRLAHADAGPEDGPRELVAWENARKAALAHLQALIRVYDLVQAHLGQTPERAGSAAPNLNELLADVRRELASADDGEEEFAP